MQFPDSLLYVVESRTTLIQHVKVCRSSNNNLKINYITHLTPSSGAYFEYFWNLYDRCTLTGFPFCQSVDSFPFLSLNSALQLSAMAALDFVNFWSKDSSAVLLLPLRSQPPEPEKCKKYIIESTSNSKKSKTKYLIWSF